jgi:hypothetical protein
VISPADHPFCYQPHLATGLGLRRSIHLAGLLWGFKQTIKTRISRQNYFLS